MEFAYFRKRKRRNPVIETGISSTLKKHVTTTPIPHTPLATNLPYELNKDYLDPVTRVS